MSSLPFASPRPFFGWHVVAATFVLASFGWGVGFYGPPVVLYAVVERTVWPVALVAAAVTVHFLVGAVGGANLPRLYRRLGVPQVTVLGAVLLALGVTGWALAAVPWQLFGAALASGAGWVGMGAAAVNALIAPWFSLRRPAAQRSTATGRRCARPTGGSACSGATAHTAPACPPRTRGWRRPGHARLPRRARQRPRPERL